MNLKIKRGFKFLLIFIFFVILLFNKPQNEWFYNSYLLIYPTWIDLISNITNFLKLNVGDLLYLISLPIIFKYLCNSKTRRNFLYRAGFTSIFIYSFFYFSWGIHYNKKSINQEYAFSNYQIDELVETTEHYISKVNNIHKKLTINPNEKVSLTSSFEEIVSECKNSIKELKTNNISTENLKVNKSYFSLLISYLGFTGYINPFTLEANINSRIPKISYPSTISHEIAHQIGYASENEANYIGIISSQISKNIEINYSGSLLALQYLMRELYLNDKILYNDKMKKINKGVLKNIDEKAEFSNKYKNPFEPFVKKAYDLYLKKNNQSFGIKSYGLVVNLLIYDYQSKIRLSSSPSSWFLSLLNSKLNSFNMLSNSVIKDLALSKLDICIEVGP